MEMGLKGRERGERLGAEIPAICNYDDDDDELKSGTIRQCGVEDGRTGRADRQKIGSGSGDDPGIVEDTRRDFGHEEEDGER